MAKIKQILRVKTWSKDGKNYQRTYAIVDSRQYGLVEAYGVGLDYAVGDSVQVFHHDQWDQAKMIKNKP